MLYRSLHTWVTRNKPKPEACEHCGRAKRLDWANVSREYHQDLDDWIALCRKCHKAYDGPSTCKNGHAWTPETIKVKGNGTKTCRICFNENQRIRREQKSRELDPNRPIPNRACKNGHQQNGQNSRWDGEKLTCRICAKHYNAEHRRKKNREAANAS